MIIGKKIVNAKLFILCSVMLLSFLFVGCAKNDNTFEYYLLNNGTYMVTEYKGDSTTPIIPERYKGKAVSEIGSKVFMRTKITDFTLPASIKEIGLDAFSGCDGLTEINIPDTVTRIRQRAFKDCSNIKSVKIPKKVTKIEMSTFLNCTKLENVEFHDDVTMIGANAFADTAIKNIQIPKGVIYIGHRAFANTQLTLVKIPDGVTEIGQAFNDCSLLKNVEFGSGLKKMYERAFEGCHSLESVILPEGLETIGPSAFRDCNLNNISLPKSIKFIGDFFCATNSFLRSINYAGTMAEWNAIEKSKKWQESSEYNTVNCTDGVIDVRR